MGIEKIVGIMRSGFEIYLIPTIQQEGSILGMKLQILKTHYIKDTETQGI